NQNGGLNTAGEFQDKAAAEIASSEPVDNASVMLNAESGLPAITIALDIKLDQLLYLFRTGYTTVRYLKHMAIFSQLMQGDISVKAILH
ncbi:13547_t:CDS:2, partial [Funneliformis geosporum]